jgi:CBS-domain-containing membrane protein
MSSQASDAGGSGPKLKRAGELMIPLDQYPHLPYWFTLRQAIAEMQTSEFNIRGRKSLPRIVLVFDEKYRLLGLVRRRDLLRGLEPTFLSQPSAPNQKELLDMQLASFSDDSFERVVKGVRERAERQVRDVMLPIIGTADYDDNIMKLIYVMVSQNLHLLPVLKAGSIVGVVRTVDVFDEIAEIVL